MTLLAWIGSGLSIAIGVVGLIVGLRQTVCARKAKHVYENLCENRCNEVVGLVNSLAERITDACVAVKRIDRDWRINESPRSISLTMPLLTGHMQAATETAKQLILFCHRMNHDHKMEFGREAVRDLANKLVNPKCLEIL